MAGSTRVRRSASAWLEPWPRASAISTAVWTTRSREIRSTTSSWGRGLPAQAAEAPTSRRSSTSDSSTWSPARVTDRIASRRAADWSTKRSCSSAVQIDASGMARRKISSARRAISLLRPSSASSNSVGSASSGTRMAEPPSALRARKPFTSEREKDGPVPSSPLTLRYPAVASARTASTGRRRRSADSARSISRLPVRSAMSGHLPGGVGVAPRDAPFRLQLLQMGQHRPPRHVVERLGDVDVDLGHEIGDLARPLGQGLEDLVLPFDAVGDVLGQDRLGLLEDVAVAGAEPGQAPLAEPLQRLEVGGHVAVGRVDDGGRARQNGVAGEEDPLLLEEEAEVVGGVAGGVEHLQAPLGALDDLPVLRLAVGRPVGLHRLGRAEGHDLGAGLPLQAVHAGRVVD